MNKRQYLAVSGNLQPALRNETNNITTRAIRHRVGDHWVAAAVGVVAQGGILRFRSSA
jgi:hypothetical protein